MEIIKYLVSLMDDELHDAKCSAKDALIYKAEYPTLAQVLFDRSNDEMRHFSIIHNEAQKVIADWRKTHGDPPPEMLALYNYMHERHIEKANEVKNYQSQYR